MAIPKAAVTRNVCPVCAARALETLAHTEAKLDETRAIVATLTAQMAADAAAVSSPAPAQARWYVGFLAWGW